MKEPTSNDHGGVRRNLRKSKVSKLKLNLIEEPMDVPATVNNSKPDIKSEKNN